MNITVIGEGAWGTAIASVLADNGHQINLWCHDEQSAHEINTQHKNTRYTKDLALSPTIVPHTQLKDAIGNNTWVFISTPVEFLRDVCTQCAPFYKQNQNWVSLSKGIENNTLLLPTQVLTDVLGQDLKCAVLSGPSFAHDVLHKQLTGVVVASGDDTIAYNTSVLVKRPYFLPFISNDMVGTQLGGALKNAVAVLMGIVHSTSTSANTRALMFTFAWQEMFTIASALGAQPQTLLDLAGIGDLFLTVTNEQSRNFQIGQALGSGQKLESILEKTGYIPEGINTIKSITQVMEQFELRLNLFVTLGQILAGSVPPHQLVQAVVSSAGEPNQ